MKTSRTKYSKPNRVFSGWVDKFETVKDKSFSYTSFIERRSKQKFGLHVKMEAEAGPENIFIDTEDLYHFFASTEISKDVDIAQQVFYALKNRKFKELHSNPQKQETPYRVYVFRLFAPINMIPTSLAVCISCTPTFDEGLDLNYIAFTDADSSQDILLHQESITCLENGLTMIGNTIAQDSYSRKMNEYYRVILNLIFYMNAFPENVVNGVPQRAIIDEHTIASDKKITISKNTELFRSYEVSPHLRRGHFRTFTSDFFTHKRGETIWINPMFVKGEALTVIEGDSGVCPHNV
jgi:hypothetical protein